MYAQVRMLGFDDDDHTGGAFLGPKLVTYTYLTAACRNSILAAFDCSLYIGGSASDGFSDGQACIIS